MEYQRRLIPSELGTGWFYAEGSCGGLFSYQGAFVFSLDESTKEKIKAEGLRFFNGVQSSYFGGGPWRETPFSDEGVLFNMVCAAQRSWAFPKDISAALKQRGSYFLSPATTIRAILLFFLILATWSRRVRQVICAALLVMALFGHAAPA